MLILAPLWTQLTHRRGRDHATAIYKVAKGALELKAWTPATRLAVALCLVVYAVCLLFVGGFVWFTLRQFWVADFFAFLGCFVIGLAFSRTLSKRISTLERHEFPALYGLLDEVRSQLGHRSSITLNLNPDFNAFYTQGILGGPIIGLGLPMMYVLSGQERVSLIAHEVAHGVNGDIVRSRVMLYPLTLFATWYELLVPDALMRARATWGEGGGLTLGGRGRPHSGDGQRGHLSSFLHSVGTSSPVSPSDHERESTGRVPRRLPRVSSGGQSRRAEFTRQDALRGHVFCELAQADPQPRAGAPVCRVCPPDGATQPRRAGPDAPRERYSALDTHPPTVLRMNFLEEVALETPLLELSETRNAEISRELERLIPALQREAIEQYRVNMLL